MQTLRNKITETISKAKSLWSQIEGTQLNESLKALERPQQLSVTDKKGCRGATRVSGVSQEKSKLTLRVFKGLLGMGEIYYRMIRGKN